MTALASPAERPPIIRADFDNEYVMLPQERIVAGRKNWEPKPWITPWQAK
ncbi:hypothetical protein [Mycobacterium asiaticum]|nr:hypothetical protein [Mycobacterium asiaticum]